MQSSPQGIIPECFVILKFRYDCIYGLSITQALSGNLFIVQYGVSGNCCTWLPWVLLPLFPRVNHRPVVWTVQPENEMWLFPAPFVPALFRTCRVSPQSSRGFCLLSFSFLTGANRFICQNVPSRSEQRISVAMAQDKEETHPDNFDLHFLAVTSVPHRSPFHFARRISLIFCLLYGTILLCTHRRLHSGASLLIPFMTQLAINSLTHSWPKIPRQLS